MKLLFTESCPAGKPLLVPQNRNTYRRSNLQQDEYRVRIVAVDRRLNFQPDVPLDPVVRTLVLEAAGPSPRDGLQKTYAFLVAPCTRYVLIARRETPLARDWTLGVQRNDPVSGCDSKKKLEKAGKGRGPLIQLEPAKPA